MDPLWYIWFAMLVAVWFNPCEGGSHVDKVWSRKAWPQARVDDTVIAANSRRGLEEEAQGAVQHAEWMNLINNPHKFALIHLQPVGDERVRMARTCIRMGQAYVKLLGGDIDWFSRSTADKTAFMGKCKGLLARLHMHVPGVVLLRVLITGVLINAWTHKKTSRVDSRAWINADHHVAAAVASVANVVRKVLQLPYRTPWRFIFGSRCNEGLAIPHPEVCLWVRFVYEMYSAMCSIHRVTKYVT